MRKTNGANNQMRHERQYLRTHRLSGHETRRPRPNWRAKWFVVVLTALFAGSTDLQALTAALRLRGAVERALSSAGNVRIPIGIDASQFQVEPAAAGSCEDCQWKP